MTFDQIVNDKSSRIKSVKRKTSVPPPYTSEMKIIILVVLVSVLTIDSKKVGNEDFSKAEEKQRLQSNFILNLWYRASEAISESQDQVLKLYSEYTVQQAQHVIEHINLHQNITRAECADKRKKVLAMKNLPKLVSTLQCIFINEENTLRAYKMTGYNLHNCIRMAQNEMETKYLQIVENLNNIKNISLQAYDHYSRNVDNCAKNYCVASNLVRSIIDYERLRDEVSTNVTEVSQISTRYVFYHIAMGCVSNSLTQISDNYKIGKDLVDSCLQQANGTVSNNSTEKFNTTVIN